MQKNFQQKLPFTIEAVNCDDANTIAQAAHVLNETVSFGLASIEGLTNELSHDNETNYFVRVAKAIQPQQPQQLPTVAAIIRAELSAPINSALHHHQDVVEAVAEHIAKHSSSDACNNTNNSSKQHEISSVRVCNITHIGVSAKFQRQGLGKALLNNALYGGGEPSSSNGCFDVNAYALPLVKRCPYILIIGWEKQDTGEWELQHWAKQNGFTMVFKKSKFWAVPFINYTCNACTGQCQCTAQVWLLCH